MSIYHQEEQVTLRLGDSLAELRELPDESVDCCVTSPPYFGLRDYGVDGQYGLEASPAEYVETMRALFAEVRRVLADDGTLWLNIDDSYAADKNLLGIPWRTAFALQDDGWILRNDIIWPKPNGMPNSVTDRLAHKHEHLFLFSKSARYWFDLDPIREPHSAASIARYATPIRFAHPSADNNGQRGQIAAGHTPQRGVNPGDVWPVPIQPFPEAHFATMPSTLAERCVQAGCKPSGTVLDPFSGSGTTGLAATKHGRKYVGIDLSADYLDLSLRTRFAQPGFDFGGEPVAKRRQKESGGLYRRHDLAAIIRAHAFAASRPWPDGSQPTAPNWNPGCLCGEAMYFFEHEDHLAGVILAAVLAATDAEA